MLYLAVALFCVGLAGVFSRLFAFEREVRRHQVLERLRVRSALLQLLVASIAGGLGMVLLGITAFFGGRTSPPGTYSILWAALFPAAAGLGWPLIVVAAFMGRVNVLRRIYPERSTGLKRPPTAEQQPEDRPGRDVPSR